LFLLRSEIFANIGRIDLSKKTEKQKGFSENQAGRAPAPTNDKLRALVRFLARRAAEKDYEAHVKQQKDSRSPEK